MRGVAKPRLGAATASGALLVASFLACTQTAAPDLPSHRLASSDHFDYFTRAGDTSTCAPVTDTLEQHFAALQGYLGFAWPAGTKIQYYKFQDSMDFAAHSGCGAEAGGCASGATVETSSPLDEHELVHAYLHPTGVPPSVFVEGIAVVLSCTSDAYAKPTLTYDQLTTTPLEVTGSVDVYRAGAWLVGYLLDVFGPRAFMRLYATLPSDASTSDVDAAFRRIFGRGLADVWSAVVAESQPRTACVWECSRPALPLDGTATDTTGPCGPDIARPFSLTSEATVTLTSSAAAISLGPCGAVAPPSAYSFANGGPIVALYHLPAGGYFVRHSPHAGTLVARTDLSSTLAQTCAAATDGSPLAPAHADVYVAVPQSAAPWFLALPATGSSVLVEGGFESGATASLCSSCPPASCRDTSQSVPRAGAGDVLQLTTDPGRPFSEYGVVLQ